MQQSRLLVVLAILFVSIGVVIFSLSRAGEAAARPGYPPTRQRYWFESAPLSGKGPWVVRAYFQNREQVNHVAERFEPWEVNLQEGYLVLEVDEQEYQWLTDLGFKVEIEDALTAELNFPIFALPGQTSGIPGFSCYRTVEELLASAQQIANQFPNLATLIDIGDSWDKTEFGADAGYNLIVLRLTNIQTPGPKPKLIVLSTIHAREYAPTELNARFGEYLVANYGTDPDVTWLLDDTEIHLILLANPDGRKRAETNQFWRKNVNNNYCADTDNRGADLNRNFEFSWDCCGGSSDNPCDETYHGFDRASEPETQAIQNYVRSIVPDERNDSLTSSAPDDTSGVFIDLHSYGSLVLWPWGFSNSLAPNHAELQTLGRKLSYFNNYFPRQAISLYPTDGTSDDFAYGELGLAAYAFELGTDFFQDCSIFENTILPDNLSALIYAARITRTPYQTPSGPDSLSLVISPTILLKGEITGISATIDDTRFVGSERTQNIAEAVYFIDVPPWITSTVPISGSLTALDGNFDENVEGVSGIIDSTHLIPGRHSVFVRGQDTSGSWGPLSAVFLTIIDQQSYLPLLMK